MKKLLRSTPIFALLLATLYFTGCKKCFHCQDTCMMCLHTYMAPDTVERFDSATYMDTIVKIDSMLVTDSIVKCTDYFSTMTDYDSAIARFEALSYPCYAHDPTYSHDFCTTKPGDQQYINYYDKGGLAPCNPK